MGRRGHKTPFSGQIKGGGQFLAPSHKGGGEEQSGLEPPLSPSVVSDLLH